jgi:hypothetical protein
MKRLIRILFLAVLAGAAAGCGDSGKTVEPKSQGPADPNIKPLSPQSGTGGPGAVQPAKGGGQKSTASVN